jgi:hypothetical protein
LFLIGIILLAVQLVRGRGRYQEGCAHWRWCRGRGRSHL